ncbi:low temperature requirement protein A [Micromonospora sp. CB01531]|uniref:low temperature requirement protein A n=1 Tax=Micromonospora sp. CB01531 TaxID=1718947 RepID=UPI0009F8CA59|nr:low temperature requirement protein A [Micromonospora sp. CB01531]
MASGRSRGLSDRFQMVAESGGVTRLELFLDLVFVYAFLNVTSVAAAHPDLFGIVRGLLLLALLWWCWASYAWLSNSIRLDRGIMPMVAFGLIAIIFVVGVAIQEAFVDRPGGLPGPLIFVLGYLAARAGALTVAMICARSDPVSRQRVRRGWLPLFGAAPLLLLAALLASRLIDVEIHPWARLGLVLLAILIEYRGGVLTGAVGGRDIPVRHWVERHALIVMVAFGETIISVGVSRGIGSTEPITWPLVAAILLSMSIVGVLWWTYFDLARFAAELALEQVSGAARVRLARNAYTFLHLPMVGGLILLSLGLEKAVGAAGEPEPLPGLSLLALYGGVILYLAGLLAFEGRTMHIVGRGPLLGLVLLALGIPVAAQVPALAALGILAVLVAVLVLADRTVFRGRHQVLHRAIQPAVQRAVGVAPKELFFDLVFVYAFIQVTSLMAADPTWHGLVRGLAVLAVLWWAWNVFAWLSTALRTDEPGTRLVYVAVAANILIIAIAIPVAFYDPSRVGLYGPLLFATCYGVVRALHLGSFWVVARGNPGLRRQLLLLALAAGLATLLLLGAALLPELVGVRGPYSPLRIALWLAAIAVDYGSRYLVNVTRWRISSASHWAERYGLIVIVALGEAIIATGRAVADQPISGLVVVGAILGTALVGTLWWVYFDVDAIAGERAVETAAGGDRSRLAADAYTFLHLVMVAGIVLVALGLGQTLALAHRRPGLAAGLPTLAHLALYGGVILYLIGDQAFWWRTQHRIRWIRGITTLVFVALVPLAAPWAGLAGLAVLVAVAIIFLIVEALRTAQLRRVLREPLVPEAGP